MEQKEIRKLVKDAYEEAYYDAAGDDLWSSDHDNQGELEEGALCIPYWNKSDVKKKMEECISHPVKEYIFYWRPGNEKEVPKEVIDELERLDLGYDHLFSWDNEDNEDFPFIADYVAKKFNEYRFFISVDGVFEGVNDKKENL